ncbi:hypothetical protein L3X38_012035 [Prunus dulcis]|uniref:Uncharacterized protein n=1 Tax=Prunus dulcis TaxID=3755 RepID=A0AAD4WJ99_PRUDU|nr:hypothetical protein L3X38_012035 [Prunus dulcis]
METQTSSSSKALENPGPALATTTTQSELSIPASAKTTAPRLLTILCRLPTSASEIRTNGQVQIARKYAKV